MAMTSQLKASMLEKSKISTVTKLTLDKCNICIQLITINEVRQMRSEVRTLARLVLGKWDEMVKSTKVWTI